MADFLKIRTVFSHSGYKITVLFILGKNKILSIGFPYIERKV
jgi:hypothetical protein